ncbi:gamma-interferon-inducible lysosomal thiol reductase-like [Bacillus rossius redtenbacheri]|uniref:gamma-interferon-inducible lysosomal thiol reductase-like n=1 Tax=Bacillus rossius redtenbacheri TaxID=93214 RepID=UPI002FDDA330
MLPSMYSIRYKIVFIVLALSLLWLLLRMLPGSQVPTDEAEMVVAKKQHIQAPTEPPVTPVEVAVFYEALCPDSRSFVLKQLLPTFEKVPRLVTIKLIPYGKAKTNSVGTGYTFTCQHGPIECEANKIHACAIATVRDTETLLRYIGCMIDDNLNPSEVGQKCAEDWKVDWKAVYACAMGPEGEKLLKQHGDSTFALRPGVSFIPTVLLGKSQDKQPAILKNLLKEVCSKFKDQSVKECM